MTRLLCVPSVLLGFVLLIVTSASATERFCDTSFENCRTPLLTLIKNEKVEIDLAFWFMDDDQIENAVVSRIQAGVKVRMLVDPRAQDSHAANTAILTRFASLTPRVPMRERTANGILHWKMMLFAGQGVVEFSGANFSPSEFVPGIPYQNYVDEAIYFSDDAAIVNSFRTMFDKWWIDTVNYTNYANTAGTTLTRSYAIYPIESEACAAVPHGCGMNFLPSSSQDDYGNKVESAINAEKVKVDIDMFRITNAAITNATIAAYRRGLPIRMIVDSSEYSNTARVWDRYNVDRLFMAGIPLKITRHAGQNHEKSVLLYGQGISVWGSSNWTAPSFNSQQEHNYFSTTPVKPWEFQWFANQFERRWNSPQEYRAFVPIGPGMPVYKTPANGATGLKQSLSLVWDGGPWGQQYDIYLAAGATATPKLIASNVVTGAPDPAPNHVNGSVKISGLAPHTTYRWQIVSKTMANLSQSGPIWSFTTAGTAPTAGATVISMCVPRGSTCETATVKPPVLTPRINVVVPNTGSIAGRTAITISGSNFVTGTTVTIGGATATITSHLTVSIQATTPPRPAGSADIVVKTPNGSATLKAGFTYANPPGPPSVTGISPNSGSLNGGTRVIIRGSGFRYGAVVTFGGAPGATGTATPGTYATTMAVTKSPTVCGSGVPLPCVMATTPAHTAGVTEVVVTNMNPATGVIDSGSGKSTLSGGYTFVSAPSIKALSPISGTVSGGTLITITGTNFKSGAKVLVGNQPATILSANDSSMTVVTGASAPGNSAVSIVNPDGQSSNTLIVTHH